MEHRRRRFTRRRLAIVVAAGLAAVTLLLLYPGTEPPFSQEARRAVAQTNLEALRDALSQYCHDKGRRPASLDDLVAERYLRRLPSNPLRPDETAWVVERDSEGAVAGIIDDQGLNVARPEVDACRFPKSRSPSS